MRGAAKFDDVRFGHNSDRTLLWNGVFENNQETIVFVDKAVMIEHTYQYRVHGVDRFGNSTPAAITPRLFVANVAMVYEPRNLQAVVVASGSHVGGISLTWEDSNIDISSEDLIGNQENLRETAVRTLFQVSRRRVGEDRWVDFPMTAEKSIFDAAAPQGSQATIFPDPPDVSPTDYARQQYLRSLTTQLSASVVAALLPLPQQPPQVVPNETYVYRVQAFQSGSFISNYSQPVAVNAVLAVLPPVNFRAKPADGKSRPFFVALNWDTSAESGNVDHWEIEKVAVNNFAAARLNNLNANDFRSLQDKFVPFKKVYTESSRFKERTDDDMTAVGRLGGTGTQTLLTGQHHFIDQEVEFGNTYFYRIRAVSVVGGQSSDWTYRGTKVTDGTFEKKQAALLSADDRLRLSSSPEPMVMKAGVFRQKNSRTAGK
jgi:hypothetical protein